MLSRCHHHSGDNTIKLFNSTCQEAAHPIEPKASARHASWPTFRQPQERRCKRIHIFTISSATLISRKRNVGLGEVVRARTFSISQ